MPFTRHVNQSTDLRDPASQPDTSRLSFVLNSTRKHLNLITLCPYIPYQPPQEHTSSFSHSMMQNPENSLQMQGQRCRKTPIGFPLRQQDLISNKGFVSIIFHISLLQIEISILTFKNHLYKQSDYYSVVPVTVKKHINQRDDFIQMFDLSSLLLQQQWFLPVQDCLLPDRNPFRIRCEKLNKQHSQLLTAVTVKHFFCCFPAFLTYQQHYFHVSNYHILHQGSRAGHPYLNPQWQPQTRSQLLALQAGMPFLHNF